ncbi:hypothetical protein P7C73_g5721, partial [Tremellales sp. Uapishka_1]
MSRPRSDQEVLSKGGIAPSSPFEIQVTKDALQRRIDKGDITQADVDILKRSYQWMTFSSLLGAGISVPIFLVMGRRRPPIGLMTRIAASSGMGMIGSFLGFTVGGAAAALEVNSKMEDSGRKMKVFQQIVIDSKRTIEEMRMNGEEPYTAPASHVSATSTQLYEDDKFSTPDERERVAEREREGKGEIRKATEGTWDKIRNATLSEPKSTPNDAGSLYPKQAAVRTPEQSEFEALLERERKGLDSDDKWR